MCILLLFNETDRLTYGDIREATQIAPAELKRNHPVPGLRQGARPSFKQASGCTALVQT